MDIRECIALVAGGASGLGEACARRLVAGGAKGVVILDRNSERGARLAASLGQRAKFFEADVADASSVDAAVRDALDDWKRIDVLVNAAAIARPAKLLSSRGPIDLGNFDAVVRVNLYGTLHTLRAVVPAMAAASPNADGERGVVINVASGAAYEGQIGQVAYGASKAAIVGLTFPLTRELAAHGIRVMTIAPGAFDTSMYDQVPANLKAKVAELAPFPKRMGRPDEFAMLVEEIIRNPMHNGRTIRLDAGAILPATF